jgi:hypothetical protein
MNGGTEFALEKLFQMVVEKSNHRIPCYAVFLDVVKAFDRVYIPKLLSILTEMGIDPNLIRWLKSYLPNRFAYVAEPEFRYKIANGVPQGSVLSPTLFVLYVADLFKDLKLYYNAQYADDFVLISARPDPYEAVKELNEQLAIVDKRCKDRAISLDGDKCKAMWFLKRARKSPPLPEVKLGGKTLEYVREYKYLGLILDNQLTFAATVEKKVKECYRRASYIWRLGSASKRKRRVLWQGFVGSYLFYGLCTFFRFLTKSRQDALHRVYFMAARNISGLIKSAYGPTALQEAGLEPLQVVIDGRREALLGRMEGIRPKRRIKQKRWDCVEVDRNEKARSIELTFSRWRADAMYSNRLKFKMGVREDDLCRLCSSAPETREHILFECTSVEESIRSNYMRKIKLILNEQDDERSLSLDEVLAKDKMLKKRQVTRLAISLWSYLQQIEYIA